MLKENKFQVIMSCFVMLLPVLFGLMIWSELLGTMAAHWGFMDAEQRGKLEQNAQIGGGKYG